MTDRIEQIKAFLSNNPNDLFLNHALALEYIKRGEEQAALDCFLKNLQTDPQYVATYYHLAKLQERMQQKEEAILTYENGMKIAQMAKDMHALSELRSAYEDLIDL